VGGTVNLFATVSPNASYSWTGPNAFTAVIANPTITNAAVANTGTYTVTITIPGTTCSFAPTTSVTVIAPTQTLAGTPGGGASTQVQNINTASGFYNDVTCNLIDRVTASGASPVTGTITSKTWIESTVPSVNGSPYVARHYEVNPATNPTTATGTITLYFLQSEFNAFNAAAGSSRKLPTGTADAAGIANLRIGTFSGTSSNNTGLPSTYTGPGPVIDPTDANIVWNGTAGRWEITFNVTGFGGFIVQTNLFVLPVTWVFFTAEKVNQTVLLKWETATELNSSRFIVEHSIDGINFLPIGTLAAAGNSNSLVDYSFVHNAPQAGNNFYRLQQVDIDRRISYSEIRPVVFPALNNDFVIIVNPVRGGVLEVRFSKDGVAYISTTSGQAIRSQRVTAGRQTISVSDLATGTYLLKFGKETKKFLVE
ncbi:MAG: hypothetical protein ABI480_18370, partial [Chitinophagaceae bacterium]